MYGEVRKPSPENALFFLAGADVDGQKMSTRNAGDATTWWLQMPLRILYVPRPVWTRWPLVLWESTRKWRARVICALPSQVHRSMRRFPGCQNEGAKRGCSGMRYILTFARHGTEAFMCGASAALAGVSAGVMAPSVAALISAGLGVTIVAARILCAIS